jgi:hypothetical protein
VACHRPPVDQLWFGGPFALHLPSGWTRRGRGGSDHPRPLPAPTGVSDHLIDPDQLLLIQCLRRDWSRLDLNALPALTAAAQCLLDELDRHARVESWTPTPRARSLRLLH